MSKTSEILTKVILEPIKFLSLAILYTACYEYVIQSTGEMVRCNGIYKANEACGKFVCLNKQCPLPNGTCLDGSAPQLNVGFWDGYCYSISQVVYMITLVLLPFLLIMLLTWKCKLSKTWIIYSLIPLSVIFYLMFGYTHH